MCGIIGVYVNSTFRHQRLGKNLNNIFTNQKTRGESGAGFSRLRDKTEFDIKRYLAPISMLEELRKKQDFKQGDVWLLHHRIPTCTTNKEVYNHPLASDDGFLSIIHNGTVFNSSKLYEKYKDKLKTIESEYQEKFTDSELIRIILEDELKKAKKQPWHTNTVKKAIKVLANTLQGRFAIAFTIKGDDKVWLFKNGNPIELYKDNQDNIYFSSEYPEGFGAFTKLTTPDMSDGELGCIDSTGYHLKTMLSVKEVEKMSSWSGWSKDGYYGGYQSGKKSNVSTYDYDIKSNTFNSWNNRQQLTYLEEEEIDRMGEPETYLPIQYDYKDVNADETENYLDALQSRNIRKYGTIMEEINSSLDKVNKGRFVFQEVTNNGEHPIVKRYGFETVVALADYFKNGKMDKETFIRLSATIATNFETAFKRILAENFNLLRIASVCRTKADVISECMEYFVMEQFDEGTLADFNYEVNKQFDEETVVTEKVLKGIASKYFKKPTRKEMKKILSTFKQASIKVVNVKEDEEQYYDSEMQQINNFEQNAVDELVNLNTFNDVEETRKSFEDYLEEQEDIDYLKDKPTEKERNAELDYQSQQQYEQMLLNTGYVRGA